MRYEWIRRHREQYPIRLMCRSLRVSSSGFHDWCNRMPSLRARSLAKRSAQVIVHYYHSQSDAEGLVKEIRAIGGRALSMRADLGTQEGPCSLAKQAQAIIGARQDILVANTESPSKHPSKPC